MCVQFIGANLNFGGIVLKLTEIDPLFESAGVLAVWVLIRVLTYNSSISPGVRRATSGRMNQEMITATVPVPAKLPESDFLFKHETTNLQKPSLNPPIGSTVDHQWSAETEHDADAIGHCKGPSCSPRAQSLLRNLSRVGITDC